MKFLATLLLLLAATGARAQFVDWTPRLGHFTPNGGLHQAVCLGYLRGGEDGNLPVYFRHDVVETSGGFRARWTLPLFSSWAEWRGGRVWWKQPSGEVMTIDPASTKPGAWRVIRGVAGELTLTGSTGVAFTYRDAALVSYRTALGRVLSFEQTADGWLVRGADGELGSITFSDSGAPARCVLGGSRIDFETDSAGRLVGCRSRNGLVQLSMRYTPDGLLARLEDDGEATAFTWSHPGWSHTPVLATEGALRFERCFTRRHLILSSYDAAGTLVGRMRLNAKRGTIEQYVPGKGSYVTYAR